jgi:hypothetical protein
MRDILTIACSDMAKQLDDAIAKGITERLGTGWTLGMLTGRLTRVKRVGDDWETFCLDGEPMFRLGPIEMHSNFVNGSFVVSLTQQVKK